MFHPGDSVRWLGSWFTPALGPSAHFSYRLALTKGGFALITRLSPPGAGVAPYLCHRLATSLVAPMLLYGADLFTPRVGTTTCLNTFWHKVQRGPTNCFSATPTWILSVESCLPPVSLQITHRQRLAALRIVCSPTSVNPATAHLHPSFPSLHQQKRTLRLIRRRCVLTQATYFLRPMRPVRPDLRCNAPPHSTPPELPRNVPSVLTQRRLLPASRLP